MTFAADYFKFVPHPEVWLLVGSLVGLYLYAARVIGPKVVRAGQPAITGRQKLWFGLGVGLLWLSADWPVHDIGERYLYLVHMSQHLVLTLLVPPLVLLAAPEWLARLVLGTGRVDRWVHKLARPIPAALLFNLLVLLSHAPGIVNRASENAIFHYGVHASLVLSAVLLWLPICGPLPELRISPPGQMLYLFVTSIVPTVPGAWLTFAEGSIYSVYDIPDRLWGISVTSDQQVAGVIMKLVGGTYLWLLIAVIFFRWASKAAYGQDPMARPVLTFDQVQAEFDEHPAPTGS
jgi:putative membrane protein